MGSRRTHATILMLGTRTHTEAVLSVRNMPWIQNAKLFLLVRMDYMLRKPADGGNNSFSASSSYSISTGRCVVKQALFFDFLGEPLNHADVVRHRAARCKMYSRFPCPVQLILRGGVPIKRDRGARGIQAQLCYKF